MEIDNRNKTAREFYKHAAIECDHCGDASGQMHKIADDYSTVLCDSCMNKTLLELDFSDDFYIGSGKS